MNVQIADLPPDAIAQALARAEDRKPTIRILERGPGFVRAALGCGGTCGRHAYIDGEHDTTLFHDGTATCNCVTIQGCCYHLARLMLHEGGALPPPPPPSRGFPGPCRECGRAGYSLLRGEMWNPRCEEHAS